MSICRRFRRRRKESSPESYVIPGTRIVADRIEPPPLAGRANLHVIAEYVGRGVSINQDVQIRFYLVRDEFLEGPDGRIRVPFEGKTYGVHGYTIGRRIILTPHGATSLATLEHEIRHIYGQHHDERGGWADD